MAVPVWAWAGGVVVLALGGLVIAEKSSASSAPAPAPGPTTPATPIPITSGHRYEVTLTFGGPTTAAALLANIVPNIQAGLNAVAPNEYRFVHASAPNNTQVVYVVDAIGGAPGTVIGESPQTFQADLNAVSMGGIGVAVLDLGLSPGAVGGSLPPAGTLSPSSLVADAALVAYAQTALAFLAAHGTIAPAGGAVVASSGNASDPATVAAIAAFQNSELPIAQQSGQIDYFTWGAIVVAAILRGGALAPDVTVTDAPTVMLGQFSLAAAIGVGSFPNIDYGIKQASGDPTDAAWRAALTTAAGQFNATAGAAVLPVDGSLDLVALALLLVSAGESRALPSGLVPAMPATPITLASEISTAQAALQTLAPTVPALAGVTVSGALDQATAQAIAAYQAAEVGLQHRTQAGVLDTLTFASLLSRAVILAHRSTVNASPLPMATGAQISRAELVAALQEAVAVLAAGRFKAAGVSYSAAQVDGNASTPAFTSALSKMAAYVNTAAGASVGFQLATSGVDYDLFAALYTVAYL